MSAVEQHPDLLAWVAGLEAARGGPDVEAHLRGCASCRQEAAALQSMRRSLRAGAEGGHLPIEALLDLEAAGQTASPGGSGAPGAEHGDASAAARHLAGCRDCRADLEALRRAGEVRARHETLSPASQPTVLPRDFHATLGWTAAAVLIAAFGVAYIVRQAAPAPTTQVEPAAGAPIVLAPPVRGAGEDVVLSAGRRATVRVALPFGAPGGDYEARLALNEAARNDAVVVPSAETRVLKDGELLEVVFDVPATAGHYRLLIRPADPGRVPGAGTPAADPAEVAYPFVVERAAPSPGR